MADYTVDNLQIEISASSDKAAQSIGKVSSALQRLKTALGGGGTNLEKVSEQLRSLSESANGIGEIGNALQKIGSASNGISSSSVRNLSSILKAFRRFPSNVNVDGLTALSRISIPKISDKSGDAIRDISDAVKNIDKSAIANLESIANAFRGVVLPKVSKDAGNSIRDIANAFQTLDPSAIENLERVTSSLERLRGIDFRGLSSSGKRLQSAISGNDLSSTQRETQKTTGLLGRLKERVKIRVDSSDVNKATKSVGLLSKAFLAIKRVAFYRIIRSAIKMVEDSLKEGTQNAYYYSRQMGGSIGYIANEFDRLSSASYTMGNQFGAAFATLKAAVAPVLIELINLATRAAEAITRLIAALSGRSTYLKAVDYSKQWADSTAKGAASAKEWKNQLMGFDEINRLEEPSGGGGGGGSGGAPAYGDMFEEADVGATKMGEKLSKVIEVFKKAWDNEGQKTVDAIKREFESLKKTAASVGESFYEVFTNGTGQHSLEAILRIVQNIANISTGLSDSFRKAWEANKTGTKIVQNLWNAFNKVLDTVDTITAHVAEWASTLNLSPLLESIEKLTSKLEPIISSIGNILITVLDNVVLPALTWLIESGLPIAIDLAAEILDIVGSILSSVSDGLAPVMEQLEPVFSYIGGFATDVLTDLRDLIADIAKKISEHSSTISKALELAGKAFTIFWSIAKPVLQFLQSSVGTVFEFVASWISNRIGTALTVLEGFVTTLEGISQFISGVFSGDWSKAWNGIKTIFTGIWTAISGIAKGKINEVIGAVELMVNHIINGLNAAISAISSIGSLLGINISGRIGHVSFPRLADGGIVDSGQLFIAREAGPELVGTMGNKTTVANNDQIVAGITAGVEEANEGVIGVLYQILSVAQEISNSRSDGFDIGELSREITRQQARTARASGI